MRLREGERERNRGRVREGERQTAQRVISAR